MPTFFTGMSMQNVPQSAENENGAYLKLQYDYPRAILRLRTAVFRGAMTGLMIRGGFNLASALLAMTSKTKKRPSKKAAFFADLLDVLRYALFLGSMGGVYVSADEGLALLFGKERTAKWRAAVAGTLAGMTLGLIGAPGDRHYSLASYVLLRGLTYLIRIAQKDADEGRLPQWVKLLLAPTAWQHGDTALMCLSTSQIMYSFAMMPQTLPGSYVQFIKRQGAKQPWVWDAFKEQAEANARGLPLGPLKSLAGTPYANVVSARPCPYFHPGQSCPRHTAMYLPSSFMRSLAVYLPVYAASTMLMKRHVTFSNASKHLPRILLDSGRSAIFLSTYISLASSGACYGSWLCGSHSPFSIISTSWICGLATLVEKKSRRMELAQYCGARALEAAVRCLYLWGWIPKALVPPRLDLILFSLAVGAIMHCYSGDSGRHRHSFRSKYVGVLDFLYGSQGMETASIIHTPSDKDLLAAALRSGTTSGSRKARQQSISSESSQLEADSTNRDFILVSDGSGSVEVPDREITAEPCSVNADSIAPALPNAVHSDANASKGGDTSSVRVLAQSVEGGAVSRGVYDSAGEVELSPTTNMLADFRFCARTSSDEPCDGHLYGASNHVVEDASKLEALSQHVVVNAVSENAMSDDWVEEGHSS